MGVIISINDDGSVDIWFALEVPEGKENNWIKTIPGEGWMILMIIQRINDAETVAISAISVWEVAQLHNPGTTRLTASTELTAGTESKGELP